MSTHITVVIFNMSAFLSVLLILLTLGPAVLSKSIARSPSWYSMMTAWLIYSISYGVLIGRQEAPNEPPLGLCVAQTLLIYAAPVLVVSAMLNFYIEILLIHLGLKRGDFGFQKRWRSFWLVITPWLVSIGIVIEVLLLLFPGGRLRLVRRAPGTHFYCRLEDSLPRTITAIISVALLGLMLPLQAWLAFTTYQSSNAFRRLIEADCQLFIPLYVRLTVVTLCTIVGFGLSMAAALSTYSDETSLAYPILALPVTMVFATQKDIRRFWLFWWPSRPCSPMVFRVSGSYDTGLQSINRDDRT